MINPLMVGGKLPTQAVLDDVYAIVTRRDLKPIADKVIVEAPAIVNYTIDLTFFIDKANNVSAESIRNTVTQAVTSFVNDTKIQLRVDINVTDLIARIRNAGALRVNVKSPKQTVISVNDEEEFLFAYAYSSNPDTLVEGSKVVDQYVFGIRFENSEEVSVELHVNQAVPLHSATHLDNDVDLIPTVSSERTGLVPVGPDDV